jgi:hypothetical protein
VSQHRRTQAIEVDPGAHISYVVRRHHRTSAVWGGPLPPSTHEGRRRPRRGQGPGALIEVIGVEAERKHASSWPECP